MTDFPAINFAPRNSEETISLLQQELADTNREVLALTIELDRRLEELRAAEQRYRRLAENAPDVILRYDLLPRPKLTFVSPRVEDLTGYSPSEYYSDPELAFRVIHDEDRPTLEKLLRGEQPPANISTIRWVHRNGAVLWVEQHHVFVRDAAQRVIAVECIARDITDRKSLEEQFLQAQKMEAVGRLAGGIAHDFNNLLTVINGYAAQTLENLNADEPLYGDIEEIYKAGERAAALTRQLLAFSRRQILSPRVLDLNAVVSDMERMLRRVLGEDIHLRTRLESLSAVQADPGQMEQVIMNLAVNARDAMPNGGELSIETASVEIHSDNADGHAITPGSYAMLVISDTGSGMDQATQARIFEPFFTTKPTGQGTGLGLSTVFGIVQQSGGTIRVNSEPGKGTIFKIFLPAVAAAPASELPQKTHRPSTGHETVLVVEDEDGVRNLMRSLLQRAGYTVLEAQNGEEALALCQRYRGAIHIVISDIVMPQMSGQELVARLVRLRPELKTLFMSGYTDGSVAKHGELDPSTPFLQKPFTPGALLTKVHEVLRSSRT